MGVSGETPSVPYHVVQRGNNREACFIEPENYQFYLVLWEELSRRYGLTVHTYCLMTNHVHFLVTPENESAVSNVMKVAGSRYAQYINKKYRRTGTLWKGAIDLAWCNRSAICSPACVISN